MFTIGEFSIISKLSVKTLRHYHEEGILLPDYIDEDSGYRYYRQSSVERAAVIKMLRDMNFAISEIRDMLSGHTEDTDILTYLEKQKQNINDQISRIQKAESSLDSIISSIRRNEMNIKNINYDVQERILDDIIFAGYRFKGRYDDVGNAFRKVSRNAGRHINGSAMSLYYDSEYREGDADIEAGFPVSKSLKAEGINCRILAGGKAVTLVHKGTYDELGRSYEKLFSFIENKKIKCLSPTREVYLKGPGMIFRGNPDNYLTEIQVMVE